MADVRRKGPPPLSLPPPWPLPPRGSFTGSVLPSSRRKSSSQQDFSASRSGRPVGTPSRRLPCARCAPLDWPVWTLSRGGMGRRAPFVSARSSSKAIGLTTTTTSDPDKKTELSRIRSALKACSSAAQAPQVSWKYPICRHFHAPARIRTSDPRLGARRSVRQLVSGILERRVHSRGVRSELQRTPAHAMADLTS